MDRIYKVLTQVQRDVVRDLVSDGKPIEDAIVEVLAGQHSGAEKQYSDKQAAVEKLLAGSVAAPNASEHKKEEISGALQRPINRELGGELIDLEPAITESLSAGISVSSKSSWADQVEEELATSVHISKDVKPSVASGEKHTYASKVAKPVVPVVHSVEKQGAGKEIKTVVPTAPSSSASVTGHGSFFQLYVRVPRVNAVLEYLTAAGVSVPRPYHGEFALTAYALNEIPEAFISGKEKLKMMAMAGDRFLKALLTVEYYLRGKTVMETQRIESSEQSNAHMASIFYKTGLARHVITDKNIDVRSSRASATALEALIGCLVIHMGAGAAGKLAQYMRLSYASDAAISSMMYWGASSVAYHSK